MMPFCGFWQPVFNISREELPQLKAGVPGIVTKHFKKYLAYAPFVVRTDNIPLTYALTTSSLDATGHHWVGVLASYKFFLEYQKGADNGATDMLS